VESKRLAGDRVDNLSGMSTVPGVFKWSELFERDLDVFTAEGAMQGALSGLKVLDLSRLLPGPFCSMLMADLGADVIKVEAPEGGDYIRWWSPQIGGNSGFHIVLNRNKRSVTIDLKSPEGKEIFEKLVVGADVVLEGFRPGVMAKLGLDFASLERINPRLVYCAISGYGAEGSFARKAGHDINYLGLNGVLSYSGREAPTMSGAQIADLGGGGLLAAFSIMAALFAREKMGRGQFVDISMTDGAFAWNCLRFGKFIADGKVPAPGDDLLNHGFACYNIYQTKDGRYMSLGAIEPRFWKSFCRTAERPQWDTPDYFKPGDHQRKLTESLAEFFRKKSMAQWVEYFKDSDCCCEPVLNLGEAMEGDLMKGREMVVDLIHQSWGAYKQLGIAPKFSLTPGSLASHAPELGEHTRPILEELGYSLAEINDLKNSGIV
jgi:crotonobetainyl-CoA:carnitine CoA-transferase CaiB-like acyl-CoA transferase